jgi:hypothetical protein
MEFTNLEFKVGDWIILKNEHIWNDAYPIEILKFDKNHSEEYYMYVSNRGIGSFVAPNYFRFATESEIKIEKIKRTFFKK